MPYDMEKVDKCWRVFNTETGTEHAKCTTKKKAEAQLRILRSEENKEAEPVEMKEMKGGAMTWREFYSKNTKGKKFGAGNRISDHMKKLAAEYKAMKK